MGNSKNKVRLSLEGYSKQLTHSIFRDTHIERKSDIKKKNDERD